MVWSVGGQESVGHSCGADGVEGQDRARAKNDRVRTVERELHGFAAEASSNIPIAGQGDAAALEHTGPCDPYLEVDLLAQGLRKCGGRAEA